VSISSRTIPPARVKLFLHLATDVNENLRKLLRYRGDLSRLIEEALTNVDPKQVTLVHSIALGKVRGTTAIISARTRGRLCAAAIDRGCSVNTLANSTIAAWLSTTRFYS
jgi:hypothetical protein